MQDVVTTVCHRCGKVFQTLLARNEVAPALCLQCWHKQERLAGPAPSQAVQSPSGPESPLADQQIVDVNLCDPEQAERRDVARPDLIRSDNYHA